MTGHTDDITLLAAQRIAVPTPFTLQAPAALTALRDIRHQLGQWLAVNQIPPNDADAMQHAVGELATNALEHAYAGSAGVGTVTITAELTRAGEITAQTVDQGRWREPTPTAHRGHGLLMAGNLVDTLHIEHDHKGTTATVTRRPSRPAHLLTGQTFAVRSTPDRDHQGEPLLILDQPSAPQPRIRVDGPVDATTAATLHSQVLRATAAGTHSLTVDLTGVSHLASAGVAALLRLVDLSRANGAELRLYAPPGTPAEMIMTLVRIPHTATDPRRVKRRCRATVLVSSGEDDVVEVGNARAVSVNVWAASSNRRRPAPAADAVPGETAPHRPSPPRG